MMRTEGTPDRLTVVVHSGATSTGMVPHLLPERKHVPQRQL